MFLAPVSSIISSRKRALSLERKWGLLPALQWLGKTGGKRRDSAAFYKVGFTLSVSHWILDRVQSYYLLWLTPEWCSWYSFKVCILSMDGLRRHCFDLCCRIWATNLQLQNCHCWVWIKTIYILLPGGICFPLLFDTWHHLCWNLFTVISSVIDFCAGGFLFFFFFSVVFVAVLICCSLSSSNHAYQDMKEYNFKGGKAVVASQIFLNSIFWVEE